MRNTSTGRTQPQGHVSQQLETEMTAYDERVASKQNLILSGKAFDLARYSHEWVIMQVEIITALLI